MFITPITYLSKNAKYSLDCYYVSATATGSESMKKANREKVEVLPWEPGYQFPPTTFIVGMK